MSLHTLSHVPGCKGPDESGDHELQIDIMRFIAILALCLMAVFALVQGLPQADETVQAEQRDKLVEDLDSLLERVHELQAQRAVLSQDVTRIRDSRKQLQVELEQASERLRAAEFGLKRTEARLRDLRREETLRTRSIARLQQQKDGEERALRQLEQRLTALSGDLQRRQQELQTLPKPPLDPPRPVEETPAAEPVSAPEVRQPARQTADEETEGFSLHFASAGSLRQLVARGRVGFYARLPQGFWKLSIRRGQSTYAQSAAPASLYAMTGHTVPEDFRTALIRSSGRAADAGVSWGVTLPPEIAQSVQTAMAGRRGGTLIIDAQGAVRLGGRPGT